MLCEDCYIGALSPAVACDPWAARSAQTLIVFICILVLLIMAFRLAGSVGFRATMAGLKRKYNISSQVRREREDFEEVELHLRRADSLDHWWQALSTAAERMGIWNLTLSRSIGLCPDNIAIIIKFHYQNIHPKNLWICEKISGYEISTIRSLLDGRITNRMTKIINFLPGNISITI